MDKLRSLVAACALLAMAGAATAAPASAAPGKGTIGIVNGKPGGRVDVCINGHEIRSNLRYGGRKYRILDPGDQVIKILKADPRTCKGRLLGKRTIPLAAGDDLTIVYTYKFPRFTIFENTLAEIPAAPGDPLPNAPIYLRYAGDLGNVTFKWRIAAPEAPIAPAADGDPIWTKGSELYGPVSAAYGLKVRATRPDRSRTIAQYPWIDVEASKRYEWILLGSKVKNAKFILWVRNVVEKAP